MAEFKGIYARFQGPAATPVRASILRRLDLLYYDFGDSTFKDLDDVDPADLTILLDPMAAPFVGQYELKRAIVDGDPEFPAGSYLITFHDAAGLAIDAAPAETCISNSTDNLTSIEVGSTDTDIYATAYAAAGAALTAMNYTAGRALKLDTIVPLGSFPAFPTIPTPPTVQQIAAGIPPAPTVQQLVNGVFGTMIDPGESPDLPPFTFHDLAVVLAAFAAGDVVPVMTGPLVTGLTISAPFRPDVLRISWGTDAAGKRESVQFDTSTP